MLFPDGTFKSRLFSIGTFCVGLLVLAASATPASGQDSEPSEHQEAYAERSNREKPRLECAVKKEHIREANLSYILNRLGL